VRVHYVKIVSICCERMYAVYVLCTGHLYNSVGGTGHQHHGQQFQQQQQYYGDQVPVMRLPVNRHQTHVLHPNNASHFGVTAASSAVPAFDVPVATYTVPSAHGPSSGVLPQTATVHQLPQPQSFAVPGHVNVTPVSAAQGNFSCVFCTI